MCIFLYIHHRCLTPFRVSDTVYPHKCFEFLHSKNSKLKNGACAVLKPLLPVGGCFVVQRNARTGRAIAYLGG
jgi:hypothetical protein